MLAFNAETDIDNSALLASKIHHLTQFQLFQYEYHCTDQVGEQLALHCPNLSIVKLDHSPAVTDACIHHLMRLVKLIFLDLVGTSVTREFYGLLLSELPVISNITFWPPNRNVLDSIPTEILENTTHFSGCIPNANILTQKCLNLINLDVDWINENLSNLAELTALQVLQITGTNYQASGLHAVLNVTGHRLTDLSLCGVYNLNLADIISLCSCLKLLTLDHCIFIPSSVNIPFNHETSHFKSLINLTITENPENQINYRHLQYYVNLNILNCSGVNIITDDFIVDGVRRGAFRNLMHFYIKGSGDGSLTIRAAELPVQHCEHLQGRGYLASWPRVNPNLIQNFRREILARNFDLDIRD
jgi:hypothetical protein